ncbi:AsmA family protein [Lacisediminimonas profundi]|uniref:AsmA family protein n=1 Tax=Lacisediminimonas profundi TaxID=2603856 RepID=UPI00124B8FBB|nr:AsmA family protein [Lacisediminimonas profundi]
MPKAAKYLVIGLSALLVIVAGGAAFIAATFNPNDYKPQIIALVKEKKQRTLSIPGEIKLSFFPKIGADLGRVSISEHKGSAEFASVEKAKVSLALLPLLSKQLIVDRIEIQGLNANIRRDKTGATNFDDLLSKEETSNQQLRFDIDSIDIGNARIALDDQMAGRKLALTGLQLQTGRIANAVPGKASVAARIKSSDPALDAAVSLKTNFTFDLDRKRYAVNKLDGELKGSALGVSELLLKIAGDADLRPDDKRFDISGLKLSASGKQAGQPVEVTLDAPRLLIGDNKVSGGKVSGEAKMSPGGRNISVSFSLPTFEGTPQAFRLPSVTLQATVKDAITDAKASMEGSLAGDLDQLQFSSPKMNVTLSGKQGTTIMGGTVSSALKANLKTGLIDLSGIAASMTLPNPGGGSMTLAASGRAGADLNKQSANASLQGKLDESSFDAKIGLAKFSPATWAFDIDIDKLDADRYSTKSPEGSAAPAGTPAASQPSQPSQPAQPIDLSALRELQASGSLRVGSLKVRNLRLAKLRLDLRAAGGKLDVNPINASLYGGTMAGSASAVAAATPKFSVRQTLSGINLGPLLKDAIGKDPIEGRGNVMLDVSTEGGLAAQLKKNLNGTARLELRDGSVKGFNIAQAIRTAKSGIGVLSGNAPTQAGTGSASGQTDFSELSGSFRIARGVAHNDDLRAKSPLLRADGSGDIDIGEDRLDYLVKATVVSTLQGQAGPELQALKGLTVPVRLSGPFTAIGYRVDFSGLATELVKKQLDSRKDDIRGKVEEQLKGQLKGLFGR